MYTIMLLLLLRSFIDRNFIGNDQKSVSDARLHCGLCRTLRLLEAGRKASQIHLAGLAGCTVLPCVRERDTVLVCRNSSCHLAAALAVVRFALARLGLFVNVHHDSRYDFSVSATCDGVAMRVAQLGQGASVPGLAFK